MPDVLSEIGELRIYSEVEHHLRLSIDDEISRLISLECIGVFVQMPLKSEIDRIDRHTHGGTENAVTHVDSSIEFQLKLNIYKKVNTAGFI